jgi:hypothetical protein
LRDKEKDGKKLLLKYAKNEENNLDRISKVYTEKEKENLTYDYSVCVIEECLDLGMNLIAIPDLANYLPSYVCSRHYEELIKRYYDKNLYEEGRAFYEYPEIHSQD